jgi:hypothetical protein
MWMFVAYSKFITRDRAVTLPKSVKQSGLLLKLWFLERMVAYYDKYLARPCWRRLLGC